MYTYIYIYIKYIVSKGLPWLGTMPYQCVLIGRFWSAAEKPELLPRLGVRQNRCTPEPCSKHPDVMCVGEKGMQNDAEWNTKLQQFLKIKLIKR